VPSAVGDVSSPNTTFVLGNDIFKRAAFPIEQVVAPTWEIERRYWLVGNQKSLVFPKTSAAGVLD
jgi:hypothetical protein